jgi:hypothetical protein
MTTMTFPTQPNIDNVKGTVSDLGIAMLGMSQHWDTGNDTQIGVKGKGSLMTYHFTALANGVAQPTLTRVEADDPLGNVINDVKAQ